MVIGLIFILAAMSCFLIGIINSFLKMIRDHTLPYYAIAGLAGIYYMISQKTAGLHWTILEVVPLVSIFTSLFFTTTLVSGIAKFICNMIYNLLSILERLFRDIETKIIDGYGNSHSYIGVILAAKQIGHIVSILGIYGSSICMILIPYVLANYYASQDQLRGYNHYWGEYLRPAAYARNTMEGIANFMMLIGLPTVFCMIIFLFFMQSLKVWFESHKEVDIKAGHYTEYQQSDYKQQHSYSEHNQQEYQAKNTSLQAALALFMFDSTIGLSKEEVKAQRNRLMKVFHSDNAVGINPQYAMKINDAYERILQEI